MNIDLSQQFDSKRVEWRPAVTKYGQSDGRRSWIQVADSLGPYLIMWYLMLRSLEVSYWLTLALALPTAGFFARIFIIFHDCGHGSFFKTRQANTWMGYITGVLTFTPYHFWRHSHALHHASAGDLDRRGNGDIWTMTIQEFQQSTKWRRLVYRVYRNPAALFLIGPPFLFAIAQRFVKRDAGRLERQSVIVTNLVLLAILILAHFTIGLKSYFLVQFPILYIGSCVGVWLFYVQHQFEGVYWRRHERWDYVIAAVYGSSFYKLPKVLQWFTGNIGFHHVHHLSPRVPNYNLERCHNAIRFDPPIKPLTLWSSLRSLRWRLWDEENRKLVGFREAKLAAP